MKRLTPFLLCLFVGLPGCDINLGGDDDDNDDDAAETETSGASAGEAGTSGSSAESGTDPTAGPTGGPSTDPTGDPPGTSGPSETGNPTGFGETGESSGGFVDGCNDEPDCASCYQCSVLPGGSCSDTADACNADGDCVDMINCQSACASSAITEEEFDACVGGCAVETPGGVGLFNDLVNCRESTCSNTCFGGGSVCDLEGDCQACADCVGEPGGSCDVYVDACNASFDCVDLVFCQQDCLATSGSQGQLNACLVECEAAFPGGVAPLIDLNACTTGLCPVSCAG